MAHAQKPNFFFRRNGRVHLNRRGCQFSRLLAAEVCGSAVVMVDTPCSEVVWRVLATRSIRQFPLHFPYRESPYTITFQLESTYPWTSYILITELTTFKSVTKNLVMIQALGKNNLKITFLVSLWNSHVFRNFYCLADPFWLRKINMDLHIVAHINKFCPDGRYPKLEIYISELISDSYQYIPTAHVTTHCMIWPSLKIWRRNFFF